MKAERCVRETFTRSRWFCEDQRVPRDATVDWPPEAQAALAAAAASGSWPPVTDLDDVNTSMRFSRDAAAALTGFDRSSDAVRAEHWTGEAYSIEPFHAEMRVRPRGRKIAEPATPRAMWRFDFDRDDRVVAARSGYVAGVREQLWLPTFWVHRADGVDTFEFEDDVRFARVRPVRRPHLARTFTDGAGRVEVLEDWFTYGTPAVLQYRYDSDRVVRLDQEGFSSRFGPFDMGGCARGSARFDWDGATLASITIVSGFRQDRRTVVYQRRLRGSPSVSALLRAIAPALTSAVRDAVVAAARSRSEPLWRVAVTYDFSNKQWWPLVWVATETERRRIGVGGAVRGWSVADWGVALDVADVPPGVADAVEAVSRELERRGSFDAARRMLIDVARTVAAGAWPEGVRVAADFEVVAMDLEGGDVDRNRRAVARGNRRRGDG